MKVGSSTLLVPAKARVSSKLKLMARIGGGNIPFKDYFAPSILLKVTPPKGSNVIAGFVPVERVAATYHLK
jgi:hypothetical protein